MVHIMLKIHITLLCDGAAILPLSLSVSVSPPCLLAKVFCKYLHSVGLHLSQLL